MIIAFGRPSLVTPTMTPTISTSVSVTPSFTLTPTITTSFTPTPTNTVSPLPTNTPTPSQSVSAITLSFNYSLGSGSLNWCNKTLEQLSQATCDAVSASYQVQNFVGTEISVGTQFIGAQSLSQCWVTNSNYPLQTLWNSGDTEYIIETDASGVVTRYESFVVCPPPSPTTSVTPSLSLTPTNTPTVTNSISLTPTNTVSVTQTTTPSTTPIVSPTTTPTISLSPSFTITPSISVSPSLTPSITATISPTLTPSVTSTITPTTTPSVSISNSPTVTPSISLSITPSISISKTPSLTPSNSVTTTPSISISRTPSITPSISITQTPSISISRTPTITPSLSTSSAPTSPLIMHFDASVGGNMRDSSNQPLSTTGFFDNWLDNSGYGNNIYNPFGSPGAFWSANTQNNLGSVLIPGINGGSNYNYYLSNQSTIVGRSTTAFTSFILFEVRNTYQTANPNIGVFEFWGTNLYKSGGSIRLYNNTLMVVVGGVQFDIYNTNFSPTKTLLLAIKFDGSQALPEDRVKLWLDGFYTPFDSVSNTVPTSETLAPNFNLGYMFYFGGRYIDSKIYEFKYYNTPLSDSAVTDEITSLYNKWYNAPIPTITPSITPSPTPFYIAAGNNTTSDVTLVSLGFGGYLWSNTTGGFALAPNSSGFFTTFSFTYGVGDLNVSWSVPAGGAGPTKFIITDSANVTHCIDLLVDEAGTYSRNISNFTLSGTQTTFTLGDGTCS